MNLYEIGEDMEALNLLLEEIEGEIEGDEMDAAIDQWIAENADNLKDKADGYGKLIQNKLGQAKMLKEEVQRLQGKAQAATNLANRLKARLHNFMTWQKMDSLESTLFKFKVQKNGGKTPVILEEAMRVRPEELPEGYRRVVFEPDLEAIREALENGEEFEWAELGERGTHLRIY